MWSSAHTTPANSQCWLQTVWTVKGQIRHCKDPKLSKIVSATGQKLNSQQAKTFVKIVSIEIGHIFHNRETW